MIDFPGGNYRKDSRPISFSYSMLAGYIHDGFAHLSACTYIYSMSKVDKGYTYAILLDKTWLRSQGPKYFYLPAISPWNGVFSSGEGFHPRILSFPHPRKSSGNVRGTYTNWHKILNPTDRLPTASFQDFATTEEMANFDSSTRYQCVSNFAWTLNEVLTSGMVILKKGKHLPSVQALLEAQIEFGAMYGSDYNDV